jgi:transposase
LEKIPLRKRKKVQEVTLDMAANMEIIERFSFPDAHLVTDRFHVLKLAYDALQEMKEIELEKELRKKHVPDILPNGDILKQLLARSRYLLFKTESKWTPSQRARAEILFERYPALEQAYKLVMQLGAIFQHVKDKGIVFTKLANWYDRVEKSGFKSFNTVSNSIQSHYLNILNFFINRSTNASAESFNAKIKAFRSAFRGVRNVTFFLFRLSNIYA